MPLFNPEVVCDSGPSTAFETGGVVTATSAPGTALAAPGANNTKGAWTEIIASTAVDAAGFWLYISPTNTVITDYLIDIGIGAAAAETVLVGNVLWSHGTGGDTTQGYLYVPMGIASGTRISARYQVNTIVNDGVAVALTLVEGGAVGALTSTVCDTYGAATADSGGTEVDCGASTNTKGAWAEVSASIGNTFTSCCVLLGQRAVSSRSAANYLVDIGTGAGGAEAVLVPNIPLRLTAEERVYPSPGIWLPAGVTAGTRIAVRGQSTTNAAVDRLFDVVILGFR